MANLPELKQYVMDGKPDEVRDLTQSALDEGQEPNKILDEALIPAMEEPGDKFSRDKIFIPEMLIAAIAMKQALEILKPHLVSHGVKWAGKAISGTVQGDLHDIGKNLVGMLLEGAGFEIVDLGIDTPTEVFVSAARDNGPRLLALSSLLTTTMPSMKDVIDVLKEAGLKDKVIVMVGGAPVTQAYADEIGADGFAPEAAAAAKKAKQLLGMA
jgi:5-methyltetrahydrofolate--homocysteine methyltransferase